MHSTSGETEDGASALVDKTMRPVLVVEDDEDIRDSLCHFLDEHGIPTLAARNGLEALETLRDGARPSVILLDLMMPIMDGRELMRCMEREPAIPPTPIVIVSALTPDHTLKSVVWLQKPVRAERLLSAIAEATSGKARLKGFASDPPPPR
jgi:CheY-like chemotaxis protein